jgi:hypothetical protein
MAQPFPVLSQEAKENVSKNITRSLRKEKDNKIMS